MQTIGIGVIGWGFMGKTHTHAVRSIPIFYPGIDFQPKLVGVCSRTVKKAEEAKELFGFEFATGDYRELLRDDRIDVVSICTPNGQHEQMAVDALKAGKHVYIDKPLAMDGASAQRILEAAKNAPGKAQVVLNNRFLPSTMRAKELFEEGKIGEVLSFTCRYLHSGSIDPNRPMGWKQGMEGGVLLDLGSHALDLVTWLAGYPKEVFCAMNTVYDKRPTREGGICDAISEDHALMMLRMENGALGTVEASKITAGAADEMYLEIAGTKGAIRWNLMEPSWLEFYDNTAPEVALGGMRGFTRIECVGRYPAPGGVFLPYKNAIGWDRGHIHCYYSFLDCIAHGKQPHPSLEEGARLQLLMDKLALSAREGRWIVAAND